jgi:hypothetical protein
MGADFSVHPSPTICWGNKKPPGDLQVVNPYASNRHIMRGALRGDPPALIVDLGRGDVAVSEEIPGNRSAIWDF